MVEGGGGSFDEYRLANTVVVIVVIVVAVGGVAVKAEVKGSWWCMYTRDWLKVGGYRRLMRLQEVQMETKNLNREMSGKSLRRQWIINLSRLMTGVKIREIFCFLSPPGGDCMRRRLLVRLGDERGWTSTT